MEEKGFKYWFTNVFWYHYRPHVIVAAAVIIVAIFLIVDARSGPEGPEFNFAIITGQPAFPLQGIFLEEMLEPKGFNTSSLVLSFADGVDPMTYQQLLIVFVDDQYALILVGASMLGSFEESFDAFYSMGDFGLPESDFNPRLLDLTGTALMDTLFLNNEPMFGMIKLPPRERNGQASPASIARAERAAEVLRAMLEYGD
jgi:hypothetical protein